MKMSVLSKGLQNITELEVKNLIFVYRLACMITGLLSADRLAKTFKYILRKYIILYLILSFCCIVSGAIYASGKRGF